MWRDGDGAHKAEGSRRCEEMGADAGEIIIRACGWRAIAEAGREGTGVE